VAEPLLPAVPPLMPLATSSTLIPSYSMVAAPTSYAAPAYSTSYAMPASYATPTYSTGYTTGYPATTAGYGYSTPYTTGTMTGAVL
jgi:hypothetical protein